ncbi:MAG: radical SAM protein [Deltaproteobacteria bacterium]|nr:radical SAM protein [Deltaproteobacteria bacterium]
MPVIKEAKHLIVPVFIPHQGCPFKCIYCSQDKITDQYVPASASHIKNILDISLESPRFSSAETKEVAFYGGTFTNLSPAKMKDMLGAVAPYLQKGLFNSIRVSTRPDSIDGDRLDLMKSYGVNTVELGVQSMDDNVLALSKRGHTSGDVVNAVDILRRYGFRVGIQLMPGLPGDSETVFKKTIDRVIGLKPDMTRLYPVIVIRGTELASMYNSGGYTPLTLDEAVKICGDSCLRLEDNNIPVIRIGLMSSPSLLSGREILAGPWHSAFGFLVRSYIHHLRIDPFLPRFAGHAFIGIRAPSREIPLVRGHRNNGVRILEEKSGAKIVSIKPDDTIPPGRIEVDELKQGARSKAQG